MIDNLRETTADFSAREVSAYARGMIAAVELLLSAQDSATFTQRISAALDELVAIHGEKLEREGVK